MALPSAREPLENKRSESLGVSSLWLRTEGATCHPVTFGPALLWAKSVAGLVALSPCPMLSFGQGPRTDWRPCPLVTLSLLGEVRLRTCHLVLRSLLAKVRARTRRLFPWSLKSQGDSGRTLHKSRQGRGVEVRTIAIVSLKGGVGKTTLALSLAVSMAKALPKRKRLLVIDSDPQGNATLTMLNGKAPTDPTLSQVLLADAEASEAIRPSRHPSIDLLPADISLADCTLLLADQMGREHRLRSALQSVEGSYEACIIDAPPTMSLINVNVLNAARELVVPVAPDMYSAAGLSKLHETVEQVRKHLCHPELCIVALALVRVQKHKAHADFERELRAHYGDLVCKATIPDSVQVQVACAKHRTIGEYAPSSPAAIAIDRLVEELTNGPKSIAGGDTKPHRGPARRKRRAG